MNLSLFNKPSVHAHLQDVLKTSNTNEEQIEHSSNLLVINVFFISALNSGITRTTHLIQTVLTQERKKYLLGFFFVNPVILKKTRSPCLAFKMCIEYMYIWINMNLKKYLKITLQI